MQERDIIITGIPRSGTTLVCSLLNKIENTVALVEPMSAKRFLQLEDSGEIKNEVSTFFLKTRSSLLENGEAISKHRDGKITDNTFDKTGKGFKDILRALLGKQLHRNLVVKKESIKFEKTLNPDFLLCVKHPDLFTAIIQDLASEWPTYAIIRNPLSVLISWNSVQIPSSFGTNRVCEHFDHDLSQGLSRLSNVLDKQIYLLSWFYKKYRENLPIENILSYEKIISTDGELLSAINPDMSKIEGLENRNSSKTKRKQYQEIGKSLLNSDEELWDFYEKKDVEKLIEDVM